jgi:hypothetical protein
MTKILTNDASSLRENIDNVAIQTFDGLFKADAGHQGLTALVTRRALFA